MHPENSIGRELVQQLPTVAVGFGNTPIDKRELMVFSVVQGTNIEDALQIAKTLSSGLGEICNHLYDSLNAGEMMCCDGVKTLAFIAETVGALVWSVQRGMSNPKSEAGQ